MPLWIIDFPTPCRRSPLSSDVGGCRRRHDGFGGDAAARWHHPVDGGDGDVVRWSVAIIVGSFIWAYFSWRSSRFRSTSRSADDDVLRDGRRRRLLDHCGCHDRPAHRCFFRLDGIWVALGYLVIASLVAYTAYVWLLGNAPMSLVATYAYVNPVVAVFLGWLVVGEPITLDVFIGVTIVVGGVVLVVSGERRPTPIQEPS